MSAFLHKKLLIAYKKFQQTNGKFYRVNEKKKKKLESILYKNAPRSKGSRILTIMQCHHSCTKTC